MLKIKSKIIRLFGPSGGYGLSRFISRSIPKILMYHRFSVNIKPGFVSQEAFEKQVVYLKKRFHLVTLSDLVNYYSNNGYYSPNSVVISIDDGYSDFYEIAFPILKKHNVSATLFVTTRFIDGNFWLWPDIVKYILENTDDLQLPSINNSIGFSSKSMIENDKNNLWYLIVTYLLMITEDEKISWLDEFNKLHGYKLPQSPVKGYRALDWMKIIELQENNIEIGAHSMTHPSLGRLKDVYLEGEIKGSVDEIESKIGRRPTSFCFPNGQPSDYSELVKMHVKEAGCQSAVTAFYDRNISNDMFELRRFNISENWYHFLKSVNGVEALMAKWFNTNNIINTYR